MTSGTPHVDGPAEEAGRETAPAPPWRVLVTARSALEAGRAAIQTLEAAGVEVVGAPVDRPLGEGDLAALLGEVDGVLAGVDRFTARVLAAGRPRLRVVARNGAGVDTIDVEAATRLGIAVTNAPGANTEAVADLVLGFIVALMRHLVAADRMVRAGGWTRALGQELPGKVLGLVGFGRIGQAVARRGRGFGMAVLADDPVWDGDAARALQVERVALDAMLERVDVLSLHAPLTAQTRHLIGTAQLRRMRPQAYLINTARGGLVDEAALARALHEGWIAGAACDVFETEPPTGSPLLTAPRCLLTPHIGAHTQEAAARGAEVAAANLLAVLSGRRPPNVVNPEVLESDSR